MRKEFGPSALERLNQGQKDRQCLIEENVTIWLAQKDDRPLRESQLSPILKLIQKVPRSQRQQLASGALAFASILPLAACNQPPGATETPDKSDQAFNPQLPFSGTWYYTGGPHFDGLSNKGIRYAVDFAPPEIINCPSGKTPVDRVVLAIAPGKVVAVGDNNNPQDSYYSIVEIEHTRGARSGYMHLDNIQVSKGQTVEAGQPLGNPSCKAPPGGKTSGIHLHQYAKDHDLPAPIAGLSMSGWRVDEGQNNYQGILRNGNEVRTATIGRCGPEPAKIQSCGGVRNDLTAPSGAIVAAPRPEQRTQIDKITSATVETQSGEVLAKKQIVTEWLRLLDSSITQPFQLGSVTGTKETHPKNLTPMTADKLFAGGLQPKDDLIRVAWNWQERSNIYSGIHFGRGEVQVKIASVTITKVEPTSPAEVQNLKDQKITWSGKATLNLIYKCRVAGGNDPFPPSFSPSWLNDTRKFEVELRNGVLTSGMRGVYGPGRQVIPDVPIKAINGAC